MLTVGSGTLKCETFPFLMIKSSVNLLHSMVSPDICKNRLRDFMNIVKTVPGSENVGLRKLAAEKVTLQSSKMETDRKSNGEVGRGRFHQQMIQI